MPLPFPFDFKKPDYIQIYEWRLERLTRLRDHPEQLSILETYYKENPAQFIIDWGNTEDPRNPVNHLPAALPFLLYEKQEEWILWSMERWKKGEFGLTEKSREMGVTWLAVALSCTLCTFYNGLNVGMFSRKETLVDKIGDPKSLFYKIRWFIEYLPREFKYGWDRKRHSSYMKIFFPATESTITGEAGDNAGRGARYALGFRDEAAFFEHPEEVDSALSQATPCLIDISTPNGSTNPFYEKRSRGTFPVFTFHWTSDPRKDEAWYKKTCDQIGNPVIIAQEIDLDYFSSAEGIVILQSWVQASIDAHLKLKIPVTGSSKATLDIADEGMDSNGFIGMKGIVVDYCDSWSGKNGDIFKSVQKAINYCDEMGYPKLIYDSDGLGAGARGDARVINEDRLTNKKRSIEVNPFRGSASVFNPNRKLNIGNMEMPHKNEDFFQNAKAQSWWILKLRFLATYRAVVEKMEFDPNVIISISSKINNLDKLTQQISQPTWSKNMAGKIMINKKPDGAKSPDLADALMMHMFPEKGGILNV